MKPVHYTVGAINKLEPQFRAMLGKLFLEMVQQDPDTLEPYHWKYKIDDNDFTWRINVNGARSLMKAKAGSDDDFTTPAVQIPALTATIYINGTHYTASTDQADHDDPGATITVEIIDEVTNSFTSFVIARMVRYWYSAEGMRDRLHEMADKGDWLYINSHCEDKISGFYDSKGYSVITQLNGQTVAEDTHYNQFSSENKSNPNREIYKRYLDEHVCMLLAFEELFKGQVSAPII